MYNKAAEIVDMLRSIEERACKVGFNSDDAEQHTRLIRELKAACDMNNMDCKELISTLPLASMDFTSLSING